MMEKEIVRALRCISTVCNATDRNCPDCGYFRKGFGCDADRLCMDAADLIERLTAENAKAEAERDALIEQIKERHDCLDCKHNDFCEFDGADDAIVFDCMNCVQEGCPCAGCCDSSRWEWRGLPEAPEG